jgi:hypothetical protein
MKLRWRSKKTAQSVFSLTTSLRSPRRIIVLLPSDTGERAHAAHLLKELYELYTDSTFCLVGNTEFEQDSPLLTENSERLVPGVSELTWSGLPRGEFVEKVKTRQGDMLIDLATGKNCFNAYIAASTEVPVRIGNFGSWGPPIYNLEIKTNYLQSEQLILKSIMDVLKSFKAGIIN